MILIEATESEKKARDPIVFAEWGQKLSLEQFLKRQDRLSDHNWAKRAMKTWFLRKENQILSSCETFQIPAGDGLGFFYGIASVVTEPKFRKKGYASEMLNRIHRHFDCETTTRGYVLFSDVDAIFYERLGYQVVEPFGREEWILNVGDLQSTPHSALNWMNESKAALMLEERSNTRGDDIVSTAGQCDWHFERERAYSEFLQRKRPTYHGVVSKNGWLVWVANYKHEELTILDFELGHDPTELLSALRTVLDETKLQRVLFWAPVTGKPRVREESISMARTFNKDSKMRVPRTLWV